MDISPSLFMLEESSNDLEQKAHELAEDCLKKYEQKILLKRSEKLRLLQNHEAGLSQGLLRE